MKTRALELSVGLFVVLGLVAFVLLALRVSGLTFESNTETYKVYAYFDNVAGLTSRAKVSMAGVNIGKVSKVELDPNNYMGKVTMEIDKKIDNLPKDSTALVLTAGLLGEKYIGISIGGDDEIIQDGDEIFDTQSALVLEELIGKFLMSSINNKGSD